MLWFLGTILNHVTVSVVCEILPSELGGNGICIFLDSGTISASYPRLSKMAWAAVASFSISCIKAGNLDWKSKSFNLTSNSAGSISILESSVNAASTFDFATGSNSAFIWITCSFAKACDNVS